MISYGKSRNEKTNPSEPHGTESNHKPKFEKIVLQFLRYKERLKQEIRKLVV